MDKPKVVVNTECPMFKFSEMLFRPLLEGGLFKFVRVLGVLGFSNTVVTDLTFSHGST